jgi:hypothetical protein
MYIISHKNYLVWKILRKKTLKKQQYNCLYWELFFMFAGQIILICMANRAIDMIK